MTAVAGAAVPVFSSPARRVSRNVALCLSLHSSPSPTLSSSSNLSALNSNLSSLRYRRRSRRRIAEAKVSSFSIDSDEEELGYGYEGAMGMQLAGRRIATPREESSSKARVSGASHDQGKLPWTSQKQQNRAAKPFNMHQARGSASFENAHASQNAIGHRKEREFLPLQKQSRSSFEEQQCHGTFVSKKHPRVPLPTQNRRSRMHNKVSVFESIRQPSISELSSKVCVETSSWRVEDADVAPSNSDRQALVLYKGSKHRSKYSQLTTQNGIQENIQRGAKFMSKLEEVGSNLKKKNDLSRDSLAMNQDAFRDAGQGFHTAISVGKKAEESGVFGSLKRKEMQSAKSARDAKKTIARDNNGGFPLINDRKGSQSEPGEARSLRKENARVANEAGVASFNLFSSSPLVPWEADRMYASTFKPRIPIRRGNVRPSARRLSTSIGSRSSPSRPSVNSRNDRYSKLDSHATAGVVDPSKLIRGDEQMESWFEDREDIELNDDKFTTQFVSQKGAPKAEEQVDSSESDAEENGDNALSMHLSTEENGAEGNAPTNSSPSAVSPQDIVNWYDSDSEVDDDDVFSVDSDVEDGTEENAPINSAASPQGIVHWHDSESEVDDNGFSIDSDVEDDAPREFDSSESSLHNKKEIPSASKTHSKHVTSAAFPVDMTSSASEMGNGSNHTHSVNWQEHNLSDLPFEFQFSYSETPKAPVLGYRETPYSPFGPSTMGRPWTGRPPLKPSKKKQWVFDSFNPPPKNKKGVKFVQDPGPYPEGQGPKPAKTREEIMGEPLTKKEIVYLVEKCERESRQLNLGRDGLTHNMLDVIHCHWKRRRVCKIKCKGVPTVDMDNVKFHIEDKTGGKIIYQAGGVLYLFRGRNYNYKDRPQIPLMLWKPVAPLYPKLIQSAPEGLTEEEAKKLRVLGRKVEPICKLGKNGVYLNLVEDVRAAFKVDELVRVNCQGMNPRDYKKIGGKLKDLVPCVLLSFDKEHILMWKGKQEPSVEGGSSSRASDLEPRLADEEILKESSITDECHDHSVCEEKLNISVPEASDSAHTRGGETEEKMHQDDSAYARAHTRESETEEKMHQSYSEQESGIVLDYASYSSQEVLTHSSDAEATSVLQIAKEQVQVQFRMVNIDQTLISSNTIDEDHALTDTKETNYASNSGPLKEEKGSVSMCEFSNLEKISFMVDEIHLDTIDSLSERHSTADRSLRQETQSEGPDTTSEGMSKSKAGKDGHNELVPFEAASSEKTSMHKVKNGLASHEEEVIECLDTRTDSVVRLDALWDHAFSSGMAVEIPEAGMDDDVIVRKAAQLAQIAPLGPTYTTKLMYKLQLKREKDRPNDVLQIRFGRGMPPKVRKKVVKRKSELPTLDVPGMGGLPVDELARLLAPKQPT